MNDNTLSNQPNSYLFTELGGIWLEITAEIAQQIFNESNIELCVYDGESERVLQSQRELEEAMVNDSMLVIYLGDIQHKNPTPNNINIRWDDAVADILDTGAAIVQRDDGKYHLCNKNGQSYYYADTQNELILMYFHNDMEQYTY